MAGQWYYAVGGQQYGPVSANELKSLVESGELRSDDLIWRHGLSDWVAAERLKGLFPRSPESRTLDIHPPAIAVNQRDTKRRSPSRLRVVGFVGCSLVAGFAFLESVDSNAAAGVLLTATGAAVVAACVAIYLAPVLIARARRHRNFVPILIITLFFGWTLAFWVLCLAWAFSANVERHPQRLGT